MSNIRSKIIAALKKEPLNLSELDGACHGATRKQVVDAANHAAKDGLLTKSRCDMTGQPLYTLTKKGKEWSYTSPASNLRKTAKLSPQPEVGQNTGSLDRVVSDNSLPEGQAVTQPPPPDETPVEAGGDVTEFVTPMPNYDPVLVGFNSGDRAAALAARNHNLIAAIAEAVCFDDDQPTEALVEHIKALQRLAEKRLNDLESMASAARKFCAWVAEQFPVSRSYPLNLYECQQTLEAWKDQKQDLIESLGTLANARPEGMEYAIAFPHEIHKTPELAIDRMTATHGLDEIQQAIVVAVKPVGKVALKPTMVPI